MPAPRFEANHYKGLKYSDVYKHFGGELTASTGLTVWTPATGKCYKVKGFRITGIVKTVLAAANGMQIILRESSGLSDSWIPVKAGFIGDAAAGTGAFQDNLNLAEGKKCETVGASLQIIATDSIGSGVIHVTGVVWGEEV